MTLLTGMRQMAISDSILAYIKNRLDITWDDDATDQKMTGIIEEGMDYLNKKLGEAADYTAANAPRRLLVEYCRYARDEALDVFENNYLALILGMQNERAVNAFVEEAI